MGKVFISRKEIQLSYADTDMMGVIYHANYLKWFELGRTQLIEDLGYNYCDMESDGHYAPVQHLEITYRKPVRYGDKVFVETRVVKNDGLKTDYGYSIVNESGEVFAQGISTHVVVNKETFKPVRFKKVFPEWFMKYEEIKEKV